MKKFNKLAASILALTLCFCLMASTTAMAASYKWSAPNKSNKGQYNQFNKTNQFNQTKQNNQTNKYQAKNLYDVKGHWAEASITKMNMKNVISGYEDASFQPNKDISRLETIVLLVRFIGAEDEALQTTAIPSSFKNSNQIDSWAKGYVAVAVEKGILTDDDLRNFRPNQSAQRYEIAVFSMRALGYTDQAQAQNWRNMSFTDSSDVPEWARGYVCLMQKKNVMKGYPDRSFRPNQAITRAEMATMLEQMESLLKNQFDAEEVNGTLKAVDAKDKEITVKRTDGSTQTMDVAAEALIYNEKNAATTLDKLVVGNQVSVLTNADGTAVFIRTYKPEKVEVSDTDLIRGTIEDVDDDTLTINVGGAEITLDIASGATIKLNGKSADVDDLQAGQTVEIKISNKEIVAIEAENQDVDVTGTIIAVGTNSIAIKVGNTVLAYSVASNAVIKRDGKTVKLSSLKNGDTVELEVSDGVALKITAVDDEDVDEEEDETVTGAFVKATSGTITIELSNGKEKTYYIRADANIERDGDEIDLDDLEEGDELELELEDGIVVDIQAEAAEVDEIEGKFVKATSGTITIKLENGSKKTYNVRADANIERDGEEIDLADLEDGELVELELEDGVVVDIQAEAAEVDEIEGTFVKATNGTITIKLANGNKKTYNVRADANIERDGEEVDLEDLEAGDTVELELKNGVVVDIQAEAIDATVGTVKSISSGVITIELSNGTEKTYAIRADAQFEEDGDAIDLDDIEVGDEVELTLTDDLVTLIEVVE
ncbi:MAG TPA: S-layer homology domain-containing protein [Syntrophomonas sp.]|nr:S-layer homology domain-containing protein [Syntrophomonas sp.]